MATSYLIKDVPDCICWRIAKKLDNTARKPNWKTFINEIYDNRNRKQYGNQDIHKFHMEILKPFGSPSLKLLEDLGKRSYTVTQLISWLVQLDNCQELILLLQTPLSELKPFVFNQTTNLEVYIGEEVVLKVEVTGHDILYYQWFKGNEPLENTNSPIVLIQNAISENSGNYICRINNEFDCIYSAWIKLVVIEIQDLNLPTITCHPKSMRFITGSNIHLYGDAVGNPPPMLQWFHEGKTLPGECSRDLLINNASSRDEGLYEIQATNKYGVVNSLPANLTFRKHDDKSINPFNQSEFLLSQHNNSYPVKSSQNTAKNSKPDAIEGRGQLLSENSTNTSRYAPNMPSQKFALLIGNEKYKHADKLGRLVHPVNDTHDVTAALISIGFNVVSLINLDLSSMKDAVVYFYSLLDENTYAVFYFAGHGFEIDGENYLMAVDSSADYNPSENLTLSEIYLAMGSKKTKLSVMLLDCCRTKPNTNPLPMMLQKNVIERKNVVVGFGCCSHGRVLESTKMKNGFFAKYLVEFITKDIKIDDVLFEVSRCIDEEDIRDPTTGRCQVVHRNTTLVGNMKLSDPACNENVDSTQSRLWKKAHEAPDSPIVILSNDCVTVRLCFTAEFSNALLIHSDITKSINTTFCKVSYILPNQIGGSIVEIVKPGKQNVDLTSEFVRISNLERLDDNIVIHLEVTYVTNGVEKQQNAVFCIKEKPLYAKIIEDRQSRK